MSSFIGSAVDTATVRSLIDEMIIDDSKSGTFRVNRKAFIDQGIFELERKLIFDHCWLYAAHVSELSAPSSFVTLTLAGRRLLLTRDKSGKLNCFLNSCSHRGAIICREKSGRRGSFSCPYHGWLYNDVGELVKIPGEEAFSEAVRNDKRLNLARVPKLAEYCGFIFICFDSEAPPLEDYLAGAAEILELITAQGEEGMEVSDGRQEYSTAANWKLLFENSADGYHAAPTHSTYFDYLMAGYAKAGAQFAKHEGKKRLQSTASVDEGMTPLGNGHSVIENQAPWVRPCARWEPIAGEEIRPDIEEAGRRIIAKYGEEKGHRITQLDRNLLIFPNLVVTDLMALNIRTFYPVRPDYMEVSAWSLAPVGESRKLREFRLRNYLEFNGPAGFATPDDVTMLGLCQEGYANEEMSQWNDISKGMGGPPFASDDEEQMRAFWRQWRDVMMAGLK